MSEMESAPSAAQALSDALEHCPEMALGTWLVEARARHLRHVVTCDADGTVAQVWFEGRTPAGERACVDTLSEIAYDDAGEIAALSKVACESVRETFQRWRDEGLLTC